MNHHENPAGISCWLHRWRIGICLDDAKPLPSSTTSHVKSCPHCAAHLRAQRSLAAALASSASPRPEVSPGFAGRVMQKVAQPSPSASAPNPRHWSPAWAFASFALAAILTFAVFRNTPRPEVEAQTQAQTPREELQARQTLIARGVNAARLDQLAAVPKRIEDPLRKELTFVVQDTRDAVKALKTTFVPSGFLASNGR